MQTWKALRERLVDNEASAHEGTSFVNASSSDTLNAEEAKYIRRRVQEPRWRLDRGAGYYEQERIKHNRPSLVETGRHAGRSRVQFIGFGFKVFWKHIITKDFFTTAVNAKFYYLMLALFAVYFGTVIGWATGYYMLWRSHHFCFVGLDGFLSAFMFSVETQQTIGYGVRAPIGCWAAGWMVSLHSILALLFDSIILGIVFARISHPKQRSRTVLLSDCAVVARRDGQLKFMFRVADIQRRTVIDPRVHAMLYTWGPGRRTAEGEFIPVLDQELRVEGLDHTLLLPVTVEHTIDETSPLFGHTMQSLEAMGAEIVVVLEAATERGDVFMTRQSYLPNEMHWGYTFVNIIKPAQPGAARSTVVVDLSRFHDVEPQPVLDGLLQPHRLSRRVVSGDPRAVPPHLLAENTLVLSESCVVASRNGRWYLMVRVGDTYPEQNLNVQVKVYVYRWHSRTTAEGELLPYDVEELELQQKSVQLRYPVTLCHELTSNSPVAAWVSQDGMRADADAEIMVTVQGTLYPRSAPVSRTAVYTVLGDVKWGHAYLPVVVPAASSSKLGAGVDWANFHATSPINMPPVPQDEHTAPVSTMSSGGQDPHHILDPVGASMTSATTLPNLVMPSRTSAASTSFILPLTQAGVPRGVRSPRVTRTGSYPTLTSVGSASVHLGSDGDRDDHPGPANRISNAGLHAPSIMRTMAAPAPTREYTQTVSGAQGDQTWRSTRSLFSALEGLQQHQAELEEQQLLEQQQQAELESEERVGDGQQAAVKPGEDQV